MSSPVFVFPPLPRQIEVLKLPSNGCIVGVWSSFSCIDMIVSCTGRKTYGWECSALVLLTKSCFVFLLSASTVYLRTYFEHFNSTPSMNYILTYWHVYWNKFERFYTNTVALYQQNWYAEHDQFIYSLVHRQEVHFGPLLWRAHAFGFCLAMSYFGFVAFLYLHPV